MFEAFFALDGFGHGGMGFVPDESVDLVFPGEGGAAVGLVARDSLPAVGGDAYVPGAVALAGVYVDGWGFGGGHGGMVERSESGDRGLGVRGSRGGCGALGLVMVLGPRLRGDDGMGRVRGDVGPIRRVLWPARQGGRGGFVAPGLIVVLGPRLRGDDVGLGWVGMT